MMNLREIVYTILTDVKYNKKYSNIVINEVFKNNNMNYEQRGFITYMVYGVLTNINYLDYFIKKYSNVAFSKISKKARLILEMAFFELIFMNSTSDYASVNEAVSLVKKYDNRAKNFVNAVLRKFTSNEDNINEAKNYNFEDIKNLKDFICTKYSVSEYIAERLISNYNKNFIFELLSSMGKTPDLFIRANNLKTDIESFKQELDNLGLKYEVSDEENMIFSLKNFKDIANNKLYIQGLFSVQDYASMQAVLALELKPYERVLDICSAPGGKSIFISQLMKNKGSVLSLDISQTKLGLLSAQAERLGIDIIQTDVNDATIYKKEYEESFDKVLCDVPCSGIGILRRKPEIRYKDLNDVNELIKIQKNIIENSSKYLKPGKILVYSTCTLGREENQDIIDEFISKNPNFEVIFSKEYYPNIDNTDGFFVCKMKKQTKK